MQRQLIIAVCGAGQCDAQTEELAEEIGRLIAAAGALVVCGGLGGVMAAVCRGATSAGGLAIGVLPSADQTTANPHVSIPIPTGMGHVRNVIIVQTGDVVIAIGGEYGTLSEIALARKCGRQVIGLNTWSLGNDRHNQPYIIPVATPAEAVHLALVMAQKVMGL